MIIESDKLTQLVNSISELSTKELLELVDRMSKIYGEYVPSNNTSGSSNDVEESSDSDFVATFKVVINSFSENIDKFKLIKTLAPILSTTNNLLETKKKLQELPLIVDESLEKEPANKLFSQIKDAFGEDINISLQEESKES